MAGPFGARRRRIRAAYDALCAAMATADGVAAASAERARREHLAATVELWLRRRGVDHPDEGFLVRNPAFADVVRAVSADRSATVRRPAELLPELDGIVRRGAPGSAGATRGWLGEVGDHEGVHGVPQLWRIGTGRVGEAGRPFDVALPLLDEAHLQIGSVHETRDSALGLVETLLLRVLSHFRPGLVSVHVWDVAQITGPLPRLHPLTRTGLVSVHDPRGLAPLLDELSDLIRRVHHEASGQGHASVAAWAARLAEEARPAPPAGRGGWVAGEGWGGGAVPDDDGVEAEALGAGPVVTRPEPWTVVVLVGDRRPLPAEDHAALARVARGGLACGVQLVLVDVPITLGAPVETVEIGKDGVRASLTGPYVTVELDPRPEDAEVTAAANRIAERHEELRTRVLTLTDLLAHVRRAPDSRDGLSVPIGFADSSPVPLRLDDASPHALIGGPSGSGKTNLLLTWIAALAERYTPRDLELYLLDFKEGVSFAQFAPDAKGRFLPHARLLGLHVNTDREFGLALLSYLAEEMRRRAAAAKAEGVTKLADMAAPPPRIVAVIDEFQYLFGERDAVTRAATMLLEDIARRGRSQGIHLILASQDVSSIDAFWGRAGIFEQFVLRIGLPRARKVLDDRNEATLDLPRWHAVVNHESGMRYDNRIVRIPDASAAGVIDEVRATQHHRYPAVAPPAIFDGSRAPAVDELVGRLAPSDVPLAVVGQAIDVEARPATVALPDVPGRNLAILGTHANDAMRVLRGAVLGAAAAGTGPRIVLAPLVPGAEAPAARLAGRLVAKRSGLLGAGVPAAEVTEEFAGPFAELLGTWFAVRRTASTAGLPAESLAAGFTEEFAELLGKRLEERRARSAADGPAPPPPAPAGDPLCPWLTWVGIGEVRTQIEELAAEVKQRMAGRPGPPVLVVLYAADAADTVLDRPGTEALRSLLHNGPETGVHVLGWWRTVPRFKALLTMGAVVDDVGAWVALDVQGAELQTLLPGTLFTWSPRPGRGLFLDRAQHSAPEVVVVPGGEP